jgi:hypothetical protein
VIDGHHFLGCTQHQLKVLNFEKKQTRHCCSLTIPLLQHSVYVVTKHLACPLKDLLKGVLELWLVAFTPCDQGHTSAVNLALEYFFVFADYVVC